MMTKNTKYKRIMVSVITHQLVSLLGFSSHSADLK